MRFPRKVVLIFGVIIIALATYLFIPEAGSIFWHIKHGSNVHLDAIIFQVPAFYWSKVYPEKNVLYINSIPGRARKYFKRSPSFKVALISLHRGSDGKARAFRGKEDSMAAHVYQKTADRQLTLAGNPGRCIGYIGPALWDGDKDAQAFCRFEGGVEAQFDGTETGLDDFYKILQTARIDKGNN